MRTVESRAHSPSWSETEAQLASRYPPPPPLIGAITPSSDTATVHTVSGTSSSDSTATSTQALRRGASASLCSRPSSASTGPRPARSPSTSPARGRFRGRLHLQAPERRPGCAGLHLRLHRARRPHPSRPLGLAGPRGPFRLRPRLPLGPRHRTDAGGHAADHRLRGPGRRARRLGRGVDPRRACPVGRARRAVHRGGGAVLPGAGARQPADRRRPRLAGVVPVRARMAGHAGAHRPGASGTFAHRTSCGSESPRSTWMRRTWSGRRKSWPKWWRSVCGTGPGTGNDGPSPERIRRPIDRKRPKEAVVLIGSPV